MEQYKTSVETTNKVLEYLVEKPYKEVSQLVQLIQNDYTRAMNEAAAPLPAPQPVAQPKRKYNKSGKYSKKGTK